MNSYIKLSKAIDKVIDYRGKTPKKLGYEWTTSGYRALSALNVKTDGLTNPDSIKYASKELYIKWMKDEIKKGDILLTSEAPAGQVMVWDTDEKIILSQRLFALRLTDEYDNYFIKYYLQSGTGQSEISRNTSGSTVSGISAKMFDLIMVPDYTLDIQQKIATTLSSLDKKINMNRRIIVQLEQMMRLIYDYWFTQFDFPDKNGKPYKTSGGSLTYSKALGRNIPSHWEVRSISEVATIVDCLHSKKPDYSFESDDYYLAQLENIRDDGLFENSYKYHVSRHDYQKWTARIEVKADDILITNAGRVAANCQIPSGVICGIGRNITAIRPKAVSPTYLHLALRGFDSQKQIAQNIDQGAFFKSFNVKGLKRLNFVIPDKNTSESFDKISYPLRKKRETLLQESQALSELRDWLLPMLMNGQVKVSDLEHASTQP